MGGLFEHRVIVLLPEIEISRKTEPSREFVTVDDGAVHVYPVAEHVRDYL